MAKRLIEFQAGELWATWRVLGNVPAKTPEEMSKRQWLLAECSFTAPEKEALNYEEEVTAEDQQNLVRFEQKDAVTRRLTKAQRKEIGRVLKLGVQYFQTIWYNRWIVPTLEKLGYPLPEPDWEDDDDEDEEDQDTLEQEATDDGIGKEDLVGSADVADIPAESQGSDGPAEG